MTAPVRVQVLEWAKQLPSTWDGLVGPEDPVFPTRRLEPADQGQSRYLLLWRGEMLVGGAVATLAGADAGFTVGRPDVLLAAQVHAPDQLLPSLVVGGRQPGSSRLMLHPTVTSQEVEVLVRAIEKLGMEWGAASIAYPFVDSADAVLRAALGGYESFLSGRSTWLAVPSGREALLRRQSGETSIGVEPLYGIDWQAQPRYQELLDIFGADAFTLTSRRHGELVDFILVLCHQDRWYTFGGRDELHERLIEEASAAGITTVHHGIGEPHGLRGSDQHCFIRIRVRGEL